MTMEGDRSCHTSRQKSTLVLGSGPTGSGRYKQQHHIMEATCNSKMHFICENSGDSLQKTTIEREKGNYSDV